MAQIEDDGGNMNPFNICEKNVLNFFLIVSLQANIRNIYFDQRSQPHPELGVLRWQIHTNGHCNSMTESA